jgi:hypothetical protein
LYGDGASEKRKNNTEQHIFLVVVESSMKTQTLLIDNLIISYHSFIGTNQRILLFLHGRGRDKEDWKSYFSTLEKNQISFFAVDFP